MGIISMYLSNQLPSLWLPKEAIEDEIIYDTESHHHLDMNNFTGERVTKSLGIKRKNASREFIPHDLKMLVWCNICILFAWIPALMLVSHSVSCYSEWDTLLETTTSFYDQTASHDLGCLLLQGQCMFGDFFHSLELLYRSEFIFDTSNTNFLFFFSYHTTTSKH